MSLFLTSCMRGSNGNVANVGQQRQHDALNCRQGFDFESVVILRLISFLETSPQGCARTWIYPMS
jgi:hypothetical protein